MVAISSSSGANFVSVSSSTCSIDLCNKNSVQQNFNFHQFEDVSKIFDEQNLDTKILEKNPAAYYFNPFNSVRYSGSFSIRLFLLNYPTNQDLQASMIY